MVHFVADFGLQGGLNVAQEQKFRIHVLGGNARPEFLENVQLGEIGFGLVQVLKILAAPAEGLAFSVFNSTDVDITFLEDFFVLGGEVFADHGDDAHLGEVARSEGEVSAGSTEDVLHAARRRSDRVKSNRTRDDNAHAVLPSRYFPRISFNLSRVAAGILLRSVRMAWANADPHLQLRPVGRAATVSRTTVLALSAFFNNTATTWSTVTES